MTVTPPPPTNATKPNGERYYRGGCARGMPSVGACRRDCLHRAMVQEYQDARNAWEAQRESGTTVPALYADGGELVSMYQLEDADYRAAFPPPTFRTWLEGHAGSRKDPDA